MRRRRFRAARLRVEPAICEAAPPASSSFPPSPWVRVAFVYHQYVDRLMHRGGKPGGLLTRFDSAPVELRRGPGARPEPVDLHIRRKFRCHPRLRWNKRLLCSERARNQLPVGLGHLADAGLLAKLWEVERRIEGQPRNAHAPPRVLVLEHFLASILDRPDHEVGMPERRFDVPSCAGHDHRPVELVREAQGRRVVAHELQDPFPAPGRVDQIMACVGPEPAAGQPVVAHIACSDEIRQ